MYFFPSSCSTVDKEIREKYVFILVVLVVLDDVVAGKHWKNPRSAMRGAGTRARALSTTAARRAAVK